MKYDYYFLKTWWVCSLIIKFHQYCSSNHVVSAGQSWLILPDLANSGYRQISRSKILSYTKSASKFLIDSIYIHIKLAYKSYLGHFHWWRRPPRPIENGQIFHFSGFCTPVKFFAIIFHQCCWYKLGVPLIYVSNIATFRMNFDGAQIESLLKIEIF